MQNCVKVVFLPIHLWPCALSLRGNYSQVWTRLFTVALLVLGPTNILDLVCHKVCMYYQPGPFPTSDSRVLSARDKFGKI